jgi:hypothetical protein
MRDLTKKEIGNVYGYYLKEVKDEITKDEENQINSNLEYLFCTYYPDEVDKKVLENNYPPFEID